MARRSAEEVTLSSAHRSTSPLLPPDMVCSICVVVVQKRDRERDVSCFRMSTIYAYICISAIYMYISRLFIFRNKYSMSFPRCDQGQRLTKGLQWNRQVQWSLVPSPRVFRRYDRWHACLPGALYRDICCLIRISIHHHDHVCVCVHYVV
jgi:hypothetical protein